MVSDKLKQTIREAVREGIEDALTKYGIDTDDPNSMQHDMLHLRKSRNVWLRWNYIHRYNYYNIQKLTSKRIKLMEHFANNNVNLWI